jgi:fructose/tagatose bisphosphate aldolase
MLMDEWQVPITVHFDHGTSKQDLVEALELVIFLFV